MTPRPPASAEPVDISVIVPVRNDAAHVRRCLESILSQELAGLRAEVLVMDGRSTDGTSEILREMSARDERLRVLDNPEVKVSPALNTGLRHARGRVVIRMDAHAIYESDYIIQSWRVLEEAGVSAVGGVQIPTPAGPGRVARAIAALQTSRLGLGGGRHRQSGYEGEASSLWLGAFPRDLALELGGFDPALFRSEDNDFYQRMRARGGRLLLSSRIRARYICRRDLGSLARQYFITGTEILPTLLRNPRAFSLRHLTPGLALTALLGLAGIALTPTWLAPPARLLLLAGAAIYGLLVAVESAALSRRRGGGLGPALLVAFPLVHLAYGAGTLAGALKAPLALSRGPRPHSGSLRA